MSIPPDPDSAVRNGEDETAVVPDMARTQAAQLAWSMSDSDYDADDPHDDGNRRSPTRRQAVAIAAAIVAACAVVAGGVFWLGRPGPTDHPNAKAPAPAAAPAIPAPTRGPLNGTFRVDRYRGESVIHKPGGALTAPGAGTATVETDWWAYHSTCMPDGACTANGTRLDDDTHTRPAVTSTHLSADELTQSLRLVNGQWESAKPTSGHQPCTGTDGPGDTWQWSVTLSPLPDGNLKGEEIDRVVSDECASIGIVINTPVAATRVGDAPPWIGK